VGWLRFNSTFNRAIIRKVQHTAWWNLPKTKAYFSWSTHKQWSSDRDVQQNT